MRLADTTQPTGLAGGRVVSTSPTPASASSGMATTAKRAAGWLAELPGIVILTHRAATARTTPVTVIAIAPSRAKVDRSPVRDTNSAPRRPAIDPMSRLPLAHCGSTVPHSAIVRQSLGLFKGCWHHEDPSRGGRVA